MRSFDIFVVRLKKTIERTGMSVLIRDTTASNAYFNGPGTGEFPAQMASNAENVLIWWRHHVYLPGLGSVVGNKMYKLGMT